MNWAMVAAIAGAISVAIGLANAVLQITKWRWEVWQTSPMFDLKVEQHVDFNGWHKAEIICENRWNTTFFIEGVTLAGPHGAQLGAAIEESAPTGLSGSSIVDLAITASPGSQVRGLFFVRKDFASEDRLKVCVTFRMMGSLKEKKRDVESRAAIKWAKHLPVWERKLSKT